MEGGAVTKARTPKQLAAVREKARELYLARTSRDDIERACRISGGTLSRWMADDYADDREVQAERERRRAMCSTQLPDVNPDGFDTVTLHHDGRGALVARYERADGKRLQESYPASSPWETRVLLRLGLDSALGERFRAREARGES